MNDTLSLCLDFAGIKKIGKPLSNPQESDVAILLVETVLNNQKYIIGRYCAKSKRFSVVYDPCINLGVINKTISAFTIKPQVANKEEIQEKVPEDNIPEALKELARGEATQRHIEEKPKGRPGRKPSVKK